MTVGSDIVEVIGLRVKVIVGRGTAWSETALYNVLPDAIILGHE
jgi:hypothetical protein